MFSRKIKGEVPIRCCVLAAVWLLLFLLPVDSTLAQEPRDFLPVEPAVQILEDPTAQLGVEDIRNAGDRFSSSVDSSVNFGFTNSAYWFSAQLDRPLVGNAVYLKVSYPLLDRIDLYIMSASGRSEHFAAGDSMAFDERPISHRAFVFPVSFEPGEESLQMLMRVKTASAMQVPVSIWQPEAFHAESHDEQLLLGLYYGLLLAIMVSNAMMALSVREPAFAYYAVYILFYAGFQLCLNGLAFEYLWPTSTFLAEKGTLVCMAISATLAAAFSVEILEIRQRGRWLWSVFLAYGVCNLVSLSLCLLLPYGIAIQIQTLLVTSGALLFFVAGIIQLRAGVVVARYFLLAWTMFLLGIIIYGLKTYALLPENLFTEYAIQVGSALETLLLSFAIAYRFKVLRDDKMRLQRESTELLEVRVAERTLALEQTLQELSAVNSRLETLSIIDTLSGVFNRAYFNANFDRLWDEAQLNQKPIAVLMIDIDNFKRVNDNHGHLVGDTVISTVSKMVAETVARERGFVARYGGEEFVVVLPDTGVQAAMVLAEEIRRVVNDYESELEALMKVGKISVSIGVAARIPDGSSTVTRSEVLLSLADSALYKAKNSGRNRVCEAVENYSRLDSGGSPDLGALRFG